MGIFCSKGYLRDTHLNSCYRLIIRILGGINEHAIKTQFNAGSGYLVPNMTSDIESGIDKCSNQKISDLVQICMPPDGDFTEGAIAGVTQNMAKLNLENLIAIAFHLKSVPAIPNNVTKN